MKPYLKVMFILICLCGSSCTNLKMYERVYVNDPEMQMGDGSAAQFEDYVESIRGSAVPAKSKKGSGGCGCN